MKRRTLLAGSIAAFAATSIPYRRLLAVGAPSDAGGEIAAAGLDGGTLSLKRTDVAELRAALRGELITAGQPGYDQARRLWNPAFDRHPALIARCLGAGDVRHAVNFASAHQVLTAVRAGGHSFAGQSGCDGGLVIDLAAMRAVEVDPIKKEARVEAGALLGHFDREAQAFGLATTAGVVADTGVAGLTLGGGMGRLGRRFGLSCDNLSAVELVLADGRWLRASADENTDLFWGLRGGGGNFGVATALIYRLHEVGPVYGGTLVYPYAADARQLLRRLADAIANAPDELYVGIDCDTGEHGERLVELDVCYSGRLQDAEQVIAPLRRIGKPLKDQLAAQPYAELQGSADTPGVSHDAMYLKGALVDGLTPRLIDALVDYIDSKPAGNNDIGFQPVGGAISRVAPQDTAYFGRAASHDMYIAAYWRVPGEGAEQNIEWVREGWKHLEPLTHGHYVNTVGETQEHENRARVAYGDNYARLAALKKRYDPTNLFRLNLNIAPA